MKFDLIKIILVLLLALLISITVVYTFQGSNKLQSSEFSVLDREGATSQEVIQKGSVRINLANGEGDDRQLIHYIHCGATFHRNRMNNNFNLEIVLLHGAAFHKEDWTHSGILSKICLNKNHNISVTALDLSVKTDGDGLLDSFEALVHGDILSGLPVIWITPSASGKSIVNLATDAYHSKSGMNRLKALVSIWVPIASPSVLSVDDYNLFGVFPASGIKVLTIHGDQDQMGKAVSLALETHADAKVVELKGRHPCYLDSPNEFVQTINEYFNG